MTVGISQVFSLSYRFRRDRSDFTEHPRIGEAGDVDTAAMKPLEVMRFMKEMRITV